MWCCKKNELRHEESEKQRKPIRPFHETFRIVMFNMSAGMLYPNPATEKFRFRVLMTVYVTVIPICLFVIIDMYRSWLKRDIQNIVRHGTIIIPFWLVLTKMFLLYVQREPANEIIEEINRDHEMLNSMPDSYWPIIENHFKEAKFGEKYWLIIVIHSVMIFPFMSTVMNFYEYIFKSEPQKYMIHDLNWPFAEPEARFQTPYFEFMYVYMGYCCIIYFFNFVGYDGFFGIAIRHACLKMRLYCQAMDNALRLSDEQQVLEHIAHVVRAQCRCYRFVDTIQRTFNFWLGMIFTGTVVHVCNCTYQIIEGFGLDLKYLIFIIGSVIHIYLPCNYASQLKSMSTDTSTLLYCAGWEHAHGPRVRRMIIFMIARAQIPLTITAFNMLTFDMELFVSILHTSYSMFTLLRPRDQRKDAK